MLPENPTSQEIRKAWLDFVKSVVADEAEVVFSEAISGKGLPRPKPPYITLKIISGPRPKGFDELRRKPGTDDFTLGGIRQYTLSMQGFGAGTSDMLSEVLTRMDDPSKTVGLVPFVGIVDRGDVLDISALLENGYESRASLDVIFNAAKNLPTAIKPIEHARVTGTLREGNQGDHTVGPFEVDKP